MEIVFKMVLFVIPVAAGCKSCCSTLVKRCAAFYGSREMFIKNHRFYIHGTSADVLYEASGGSDDWAHGQIGIPYSMTVELPDDGAYGFLLPPAYVRNVGNEAIFGLLAMLRTIHDLETNTNFFQTNCPNLPLEYH